MQGLDYPDQRVSDRLHVKLLFGKRSPTRAEMTH
jgi:hypothetical protein